MRLCVDVRRGRGHCYLSYVFLFLLGLLVSNFVKTLEQTQMNYTSNMRLDQEKPTIIFLNLILVFGPVTNPESGEFWRHQKVVQNP